MEPTIIIGNKMLTEAQSMTVRVALSNFQLELMGDPLAIGDDEHGQRMRAAYLARLSEIAPLVNTP
jgi:hypothetical protein